MLSSCFPFKYIDLFLGFIIHIHQTSALKQKSCREHFRFTLAPVKVKPCPITCALTWGDSCQTHSDSKRQSNGRGEYYPVQSKFKTLRFFLSRLFWKHLQLRGLSPALLDLPLHTSEKSPPGPGPVQSPGVSAEKQTAVFCGSKPSQRDGQLLHTHCLGLEG